MLAIDIALIWSKVWPVLLAVLFFGMIIFVHEFGHFFTAKLNGVTVHEFAIGMGPLLFRFKKGDTVYSLRLFPIGGFNRMEGEDEESDAEGAFCNKKVWKRIVIVAAGALMNLLLGFLMLGLINGTDDLIGTRTVADFYDNAVSCDYGLQVNDKIIEINGTHIFNSTDLSYAMVRDSDAVFDFVVIRDGEKVKLENVKFGTQDINGRETVIFDFILYGVEKTPWLVIRNTFLDTLSTARIVWLSLFDIVTGRYGLKDLSGPIGTIGEISKVVTSEQGTPIGDRILTVIEIMAFISINIGVFNLLPIPALDGGRLFFLIIEAIRRKPILPKYEKYVHAAGMVLLLALIAVVSVKDIIYLFK
ncbi:MAG: site-2 protease family protein [Clostridia bacterium]|nr:site-2 protease family protein [Clostridia bacterium]